MKKHFRFLALASVVFVALLGCGLTDQLVANTVGGAKGNTVSNLWTDVPPIPGAQKQNLDLPIPVQLAIQGLIKASASSNDVKLDQFDWIAYSTTQTPQQVGAFYSKEKMAAAGWNAKDAGGCSIGGDANASGGICMFGRGKATANERGSGLFIIVAQDDKTKQTQLYFVRLEGIIIGATPTRAR